MAPAKGGKENRDKGSYRPWQRLPTVQKSLLNLLIIRTSFVCGTFSFTLRMFFVFFPLFFLVARAGRPLSLSPISTVVWLKYHRTLLAAS